MNKRQKKKFLKNTNAKKLSDGTYDLKLQLTTNLQESFLDDDCFKGLFKEMVMESMKDELDKL